jgi:predicted dehydrogenase
MKQLLQNLKTGQTMVEEVPVPTPRRGQALVQVAASLVSAGTERMVVEFAEKNLLGKARSRPDLVKQVLEKARREGVLPTLQAAFNRLDQPMALGYSSAGTIIALGEEMPGFHIGQRVACAGSGYATHAEYNLVPRQLLTPLPPEVDFESAAFTTLGAIALHGLRLAEPQLGENIAIIGLGLVGLLTIQLAAAAGCHVLGIDLDPQRVALAASLGHPACLRSQAESTAQALTAGRGFDAVLICADTPATDPVELAGLLARDRARVIATGAVGLNLPRKIYYEKELTFINSRSYGPGRYDPSYEEQGHDYPIGYIRWTEGRNFEAIVGLLASGKLNVQPLITHRFPIERAPEAYEIITGKKKEPFLGVILTYPHKQAERGRKIPLSASATQRAPSAVKLGVLGAGLYANATLLPLLRKIKKVELIGIASSGGMHATHAGKRFGFRYACSAEEQIIHDPEINTVLILTRHDNHADLSVEALQAGKHVFVEKPLALNEEQLAKITKQIAQENSPLFMVGFNRRFAPLAQSLAAFLTPRQEALYAHYRINAGYIPPNHWVHDPEQGGGRIIGEACHFIDFITFLVGAPPVTVSAHALPDHGKYHQDNVSITLTFPDGSIGIVDYLANGDKSLPKERLEVFCEGKVAILDDFRRLERIGAGSHKIEKHPQDKGWKNELVAFFEAIETGAPPPIPAGHLIAATKATFAVITSLQNNGQPVTLPITS